MEKNQLVNQKLILCVLAIVALAKGTHSWPLGSDTSENGTVFNNAGEGTPTCSSVCEYSHSKARCQYRNLLQIPHSTGCEGAILLELQGNKITSITLEQMSGYQQVSTLDVSGNCLSNITPGTFDSNPNLKNVDISYNNLTVLHSKMFKGTEHSLFQIEIQYNSISLVTQDALEGLGCVSNIYLSHNKLQNPLPGIFKDLISLQYLDLSRNELVRLPQNLFQNLTSLRKLYLHGNKLQQIPNKLFAGLESLTDVKLSDNLLISVPSPKSLCLLHQLWSIDLQNNKIYQSGVILPFLANVTENLQVAGNPLLCDCSFQQLQNSLQVTSQTQPIQCMYHDGSNFTISQTLPFDCKLTTQAQPTLSNYANSDKSLPGSTQDGHFDDITSASPPENPKCEVETHTICVTVICALIAGLIICLICSVSSIRSKFCGFCGSVLAREQRNLGSKVTRT